MSSHLTGLSKAFGNTSDPRYLFQSQTHANALSLLAAGTEESRNIRVLIGEPGMGKTILLLHLLGRFQHSALTAHLFWTQLGRGEFLHYFLHELGVLQPPADIAQARKQLTRVLEREFSQGRGVVVAIDEAHDLEVPALLGLAELLDCSLARSKQLQVILAGLPHLVAKLASPELQGIRDRISAIASLSPLTHEETASYISRRLEVSGYRGDVPFTSEAMVTIAGLAEGIPRNINNICSGALYLAEKRACSVIDCGIILETAQREGRLTGQDIRQEALSDNLAIPHDAASDQQTFSSVQPHLSAADSIGATVGDEASQGAVAAILVDNEATAMPDRIRQWFGNERVAWSGTIGELAAALHESEIELLEALHAHSEGLRSFGIAVTVCETVGRMRSVSLRRLEGRKQASAEGANTRPSLPASELDSAEDSDASNLPAENVPSHGQPSRGPIEGMRTENLEADTASGSAADQALDLLRATALREVTETRVSSSRWAVLALLIALVALAVGLAGGHRAVQKRKDSVMRLAQQPSGSKAPSKALIAGKEESRVPSNTKTNPFSPSGQESAQESAPPVSSTSQPLSASPVPQQHGGRPEAAETREPFQQAALSGDPNAQFELGTAYALGRGVPADPVVAYTWLTLAFANGDEQAESLIRELTRKLSQSEIARIRWNLGEMYANGVGVPPDKVTAYMWHLLAEFAGETRSRIARSQLDPTMTADQKSEANARAAQWLRRHQQPSKHVSLPARQM